jgi:hypothetical protein
LIASRRNNNTHIDNNNNNTHIERGTHRPPRACASQCVGLWSDGIAADSLVALARSFCTPAWVATLTHLLSAKVMYVSGDVM